MSGDVRIPSIVDATLIQHPHSLRPRAREDVLEVWRFDLDACCPDENAARTAWQVLDAEERKRASAFVFANDRRRFVAGRSLLRMLLGRYLGIAPAQVMLRRSSTGKPFLDPVHGASHADGAPLNFNLSHSERVCYVAVLAGEQIGIDVELDRAIDDAAALARMVFSAQEMDELWSQKPSEQNQAFLQGWARKEAFVKLLGAGLGADLQAITVGLDKAAVLVAPIVGISSSPLRVCTLSTPPGEYAAVAYTGPAREIVLHHELDASGSIP